MLEPTTPKSVIKMRRGVQLIIFGFLVAVGEGLMLMTIGLTLEKVFRIIYLQFTRFQGSIGGLEDQGMSLFNIMYNSYKGITFIFAIIPLFLMIIGVYLCVTSSKAD